MFNHQQHNTNSSSHGERAPSKSSYDEGYELTLSDSVTLVIAPGAVSEQEEFCQQTPSGSLALDGRVAATTFIDTIRKSANVDHHSGVDRLHTPCTAAQVRELLKDQDFLSVFDGDGDRHIRVYVNDCDPDVCFALWAIVHREDTFSPAAEDLIQKLFRIVDLTDRLGGIAPLDPERRLIRQLAWIHEPYEEARMSETKSFSDLEGRDMAAIISAVHDRIDAVIAGNGKEHDLDVRFDVLHRGPDWMMVQEHGYYARSQFGTLKLPFFVSVRPSKEDGSSVYSVGKIDPRHPGNIDSLYLILNAAESHGTDAGNCWGGSDLIGGSPRSSGSSISQDNLIKILDHWFVYSERYGDSVTDAEKFVNEHLQDLLAIH